jgi:hypothetical protein
MLKTGGGGGGIPGIFFHFARKQATSSGIFVLQHTLPAFSAVYWEDKEVNKNA